MAYFHGSYRSNLKSEPAFALGDRNENYENGRFWVDSLNPIGPRPLTVNFTPHLTSNVSSVRPTVISPKPIQLFNHAADAFKEITVKIDTTHNSFKALPNGHIPIASTQYVR